MHKEKLLRYLEEGLKHILLLKPGLSNDGAIEEAVETFIQEEASQYSTSELLSRFETMEKGLGLFLDFLEKRVPVQIDADGQQVHYFQAAPGYPVGGNSLAETALENRVSW